MAVPSAARRPPLEDASITTYIHTYYDQRANTWRTHDRVCSQRHATVATYDTLRGAVLRLRASEASEAPICIYSDITMGVGFKNGAQMAYIDI